MKKDEVQVGVQLMTEGERFNDANASESGTRTLSPVSNIKANLGVFGKWKIPRL